MIYLGSDHAGTELKQTIIDHLQAKGVETTDLGVKPGERGDYPVYGSKVAKAVREDAGSLGIVVCGSGVGISVSANKHVGIRCVVCSEPYSALMAREHNDANMLALGQRVVGDQLACLIVDTFLAAEFQGDRHARRVGQIADLERSELCGPRAAE